MVERWPSKPVMRVRSPSLALPGPVDSPQARGRARIRLASDGGRHLPAGDPEAEEFAQRTPKREDDERGVPCFRTELPSDSI